MAREPVDADVSTRTFVRNSAVRSEKIPQ
jgi:hypothetical protein